MVELGRCPYAGIEERMRAFTASRDALTEDELWLVEHEPVYTLGVAGRLQHVLAPGDIPVVRTHRGGQVTYHGPGQLVAYPLVDLRRLGIYVKEYVFRLETAVLQVLQSVGVTGHRVSGAPGIYVRLDDPFDHAPLALSGPSGSSGPLEAGSNPFAGLGKVAALGIKVSQHCSYHGLSLNIAMDLSPFTRIDPCGYSGLRTVDLHSLGVTLSMQEAAARLSARLQGLLSP